MSETKLIQRYKGKKSIAGKLMYIPNNNIQNYRFCRLTVSGCFNWTLTLINQPIKIQSKFFNLNLLT